jgi:hypothetical protein
VTDEGLLVRFEDDTTAADAQVVLATGLNTVPEHPLVGSVAESLSLERGEGGEQLSRPQRPDAHMVRDR